MKSEQLASLGQNLRRDFQALLTGYATNWLDDEPLSQADIQPVHVLQADLAQLAYVAYEFAGLEARLTSGFIPADLAPLNNPAATPTGETAPMGPARFIQKQPLVQNKPLSGGKATIEHRDRGSLPADAYPPYRPVQAPLKSLEALARWLASESTTPDEEAEAAGPAAMATPAWSRDLEKVAMSKKSGGQDFEASRLSNSSDDRPVFLPGTDERPAVVKSIRSTAGSPSRPDPGAIPATWQTLLRLAGEEAQYPEFDAVTETLGESPKVQPGVAPNQAPAIGRRSNALTQASSMAATNLRSDTLSEPEGKPGGNISPDTPSNQGVEAGWPASEATAGSDLSPVEPPADLAEILEALARSLEQEYKRYYGS